ncbi:MAG: hypothetical protein HQM16_14435 [Deltaproteobacteria bacterium]|nr:hypothetical protein [Deltaproteobacteria bacterium]
MINGRIMRLLFINSKIITKLVCLSLIFLLLDSCSTSGSATEASAQTSSQEPRVTLMVLPPELSAVSASLTSTLTIYSSTVSQIYHRSLSFAEDSDGNDVVTSPSLNLTQGSHYRFVVVFYWDNVVFAYVDTVLQVPDEEVSEISYEAADITYDASDPNSDIAVPSLSDQDSLDLTLQSVNISYSAEDDLLSINAEVESSDPDVILTATILDDAETVQTATIDAGGSSANGLMTFEATMDTQALEAKSYRLKILASETDGTEASFTTVISVD